MTPPPQKIIFKLVEGPGPRRPQEVVQLPHSRRPTPSCQPARRIAAALRTDCLLLQGLPKSRQESLEALTRLRHQDGTPVFRVEECKPLLGRSAPPRMEAERPALPAVARGGGPPGALRGRQLPVAHRPAGTGKTYLARKIVARLREQGEAVRLVSNTHCSAQNLGLGAQTADHWVRRYVRNGSVQKLDWLVVEEIAEPAEPSAEHAGVAGAPADRGRWEDSQGRLCGRYRGGPEHVRLDNGLRLKQQELGSATPSPAPAARV